MMSWLPGRQAKKPAEAPKAIIASEKEIKQAANA
jgi:hypothetical protein